MLGELLPLCAGAVFTTNANPRALSPATLVSLAGQLGMGAEHQITCVEPDPHRALAVARELAGEHGVVLATGSIYLIADLARAPGSGPGSML
jgi:dihydrofolate synthase/folylpolyglutamate synthase